MIITEKIGHRLLTKTSVYSENFRLSKKLPSIDFCEKPACKPKRSSTPKNTRTKCKRSNNAD